MSIPQIRYRVFGREGTVDHAQMRDLIRHGEVTSLSDIAPDGTEQWQAAGNFPELQRYFMLAATSPPQIRSSTGFNTAFAIGILMMIAGFVFAISSVRDFFNGIASSHWPSAEARLIYTQVIDESTWWSSLLTDRRHRLNHRPAWRLYVGYEYFVNGQKYHSNAIAFGSEFDGALHQRYRFQYEKPLLARYDPDMPSRAVLDPGVTLGSVGTVLGGATIMLLGGLIAFVPGFSGRAANTLSTARGFFFRR